MLISIIMTVYNGERFLRQAIESCLNQSYTDIELVIIDDGSTDNSLAIIESFNDTRIHLITNSTNKGQSFSRNLAIKESKGAYIAIMDADDIAYPNRLERQIEFMKQNPHISLCGSWAHLIDEFGRINGTKKGPDSDIEIKLRLLFYCPIIHPSVMWRKADFEQLDLYYDPHFVYAQDFDLWTRAMAKDVEFHILQEPLLQFRFKHAGSISGAKTSRQGQYAREIINRNFRAFIGTEYQPDLGLWQQRALFQQVINAPFLRGHRKQKIEYFRKRFLENSKLPYRVKTFLRILAIN